MQNAQQRVWTMTPTAELVPLATKYTNAVAIVLKRLTTRHHCLVVHYQMYRDPKSQWCITDREDQLVYSSPSAVEAAGQLVLMEGPDTVLTVLERRDYTRWEKQTFGAT